MKALVLDANILIRAVLGTKVNSLITTYAKQAQFYTPQECFEDARRYLPDILSSKGIPTDAAIAALDALAQLVGSVEPEWYGAYEGEARARIKRDEDDWPIVATALAFDCPVWTQDPDFFGAGIATWVTDTVEIYLAPPAA